MKYQANPEVVYACRILHVGDERDDGSRQILYANNAEEVHGILASAEVLARYIPIPDDYFVTQEDGYTYVSPKAVFERKYSRLPEPPPVRPPIRESRLDV